MSVCEVLLCLEEIFKNPKLFIAMIFMEWAFEIRSEHCPENIMKALVIYVHLKWLSSLY